MFSRSEIQRSASESGWGDEMLSMARLPFTRREADAIAALVPAAYRKQELDFAANLSNATSSDLSQYRIVHFATHGFLNSRHPELSGIVLSLVDEKGQERNGFLRAHEIYELKLPAELVVLSGCRTGLGKDIRGEGLIGLTRAFMHAGAARVLVSLWDVNDQATAELFTRFYTRLLGPEKVSPAAALRAAQVSMARDKRWSSPYFWAGFTLQGEPR
jgi:CHAT domain-containing protein